MLGDPSPSLPDHEAELAALDDALGLSGEGRTRYEGQRVDMVRGMQQTIATSRGQIAELCRETACVVLQHDEDEGWTVRREGEVLGEDLYAGTAAEVALRAMKDLDPAALLPTHPDDVRALREALALAQAGLVQGNAETLGLRARVATLETELLDEQRQHVTSLHELKRVRGEGEDAVRRLERDRDDAIHERDRLAVECDLMIAGPWAAPTWLAKLLSLDDDEPVTQADVEGTWRDLRDPVAEALELDTTPSELGLRAADAIRRGRSRSALDEVLDEIARLCGCPTWDYPGQLVRDVRRLADERDALRLERDQLAADRVRAIGLLRRVTIDHGDEAAVSPWAESAVAIADATLVDAREAERQIDALHQDRDRALARLVELLPREQRPALDLPLLVVDVVEKVATRQVALLERLGAAVDGRHDAHVVGQLVERLLATVQESLGPEFPLAVRLAHVVGRQDVWKRFAAPPVVVHPPNGDGTDA